MENSAADWARFLSATEIFREVPEPALRALASQLEVVDLGAGETLIRQGEPGDCMYFVVSGRIQVVHAGAAGEEKFLAELGPGHCVGELALWTGDLRSATVRTVSQTRVAKLTRAGFDHCASLHPRVSAAVDGFVAVRLRRNRLSLALRVSKLFGQLEEGALLELEEALEPVWIEGGTTLFRQGEAGDALYLVVSGRLQVLVQANGEKPRVVAELGYGETVGEMALLEGEPRSATVLALRDSQVARLSSEAFEHLASGRHALLLLIARSLVKRLRAQNTATARRAPMGTVIAVTPVSPELPPDLPLSEFCARLAEALSSHGRTLLLGSERLDSILGKPGAAQATEREAGHGRILETLSKIEEEHRYVVYQADASDSPWTRRCLRQCDRVLMAGDAAAGPPPALSGGSASPRSSLVLLHRKAGAQLSGTAAWLAATQVDQHYQVRLESKADFERLARSLTGRAVGLVLGGGAARGLGHAGVIRAVREAGIPVDMVGGTSMGSIIGAMVALEWGHERMLRMVLDNGAAVVGDRTFPSVAFLSGFETHRVIYGAVGEMQVEDLWLPFFCISANLTRSRFEVHRRGPLVKSILASTRMPGIFPPVVWDGDLLVDGGIINNVPVDVMRGFPDCGVVIASDVSPVYDPSGVSDYGPAVSGWRVLAQRLKPVSKRLNFPSITSVMLRSMDFGGAAYRSQTMGAADLYLSPPLARFKLSEFQAAQEMADVSYRYSVEKIAEWLASSPAALR
jgi:lysophospholipid hydrolase